MKRYNAPPKNAAQLFDIQLTATEICLIRESLNSSFGATVSNNHMTREQWIGAKYGTNTGYHPSVQRLKSILDLDDKIMASFNEQVETID